MNDRTDEPESPPERAFLENEDTAELIEHALINLWSVANDLSRIKPPQDRFRVTIFGSSRTEPGNEIYDQVKELARRLSEMGCDIVTGGGPGLMQAANEGEAIGDPDSKTESLGIRVQLPFEQGANPYATTVYSHQTFFTRLHHFVRLSHAFVVVQGGIGTSLELLMIWQLLQVRHIDRIPLIVLGDMWEELRDWARRHMTDGENQFADPEDVNIPICANSVEETVRIVRETKNEIDLGSDD